MVTKGDVKVIFTIHLMTTHKPKFKYDIGPGFSHSALNFALIRGNFGIHNIQNHPKVSLKLAKMHTIVLGLSICFK